jgi:hypothetical protein
MGFYHTGAWRGVNKFFFNEYRFSMRIVNIVEVRRRERVARCTGAEDFQRFSV